jgi:hypothetical protein
MTFGQRDGVKAESGSSAGPPVLHDNVAARHEGRCGLAPAGRVQVQLDASLVAVDRQEVCRGVAHERRPPVPRVVATPRPLDLDHVGAEGEQVQQPDKPG